MNQRMFPLTLQGWKGRCACSANDAMPAPAAAGWAAVRMRGVAGRAQEPGSSAASPPASAASSAARAPYRVEVIARAAAPCSPTTPRPARFQNAPTPRPSTPASWRLPPPHRRSAHAAFETEGYFGGRCRPRGWPAATASRWCGCWWIPARALIPHQVDFTVDGELQTLADQLDEDAAALRTSLRRGWPLRAGEPFRQAAWASAKTGTLAQARAEGYGRGWTKTEAQVDAEQHQVALTLALDSGALYHPRRDPHRGLERYDEERGAAPVHLRRRPAYNEAAARLPGAHPEARPVRQRHGGARPDPKTSAAAPCACACTS